MPSTSPIRIDDELYAAAKAAGDTQTRSASQQIAHWARIGRELEASGSVSARDIAWVLAGRVEYDSVGHREQAVVRAEWDAQIARRRADLDFEQEFRESGAAYAELDDAGHAVRRSSE